MWRTYTAGTFTPKRKGSAVHSSSSTRAVSDWPRDEVEAVHQRRSSSLSASLDELIQREEQKQQQLKKQQLVRGVPEAEQQETEQQPDREEKKREEKAGEASLITVLNLTNHSTNSTFVDPTAPSISAPVSSSTQRPTSPLAPLFVARKQSQQQSNQLFLVPLPPADAEQRKISAASADGGERLRTQPLPAQQQQRSGSVPPVMDANNTEPRATISQNAKNAKNNANASFTINNNSSEDNANNNMFDRQEVRPCDRTMPTMPTTDGIEYPRAASWSSSTVAEIMRDTIGRQVFRCFLHEALAEENLLFVEEVEKLKKEKQPERIRHGVQALLDKYGTFINLSSVAMSKLREATKAEMPDPKCLDMAHKEIYKLLENDQFPRFRRSQLYLGFLEELLPRSYAERWTTSFDALLGNQVGRHHFRQFLFNVHAEENLRFWESVIEFRQQRNKSSAMQNMGRTIQQQFLREGAHNEVFLPFGLRQRVEKKIREKDVDETLFDESVKHVEQILKNDPYVRFLQSKEYNDLLAKLH